MKVHEENWEVHHSPSRGEVHITEPASGRGPTRSLGIFTGDDAFERAKLAAQAPAMARLLLWLLDTRLHDPKRPVDIQDHHKVTVLLRAAGVLP